MKTDQTQLMQTVGLATPGGLATADLISVSTFERGDGLPAVSAGLSPALLLLFHRLACFDLPTRVVGKFRTEPIFLTNSEGQKATHIQPPPAEEVQERLTNLCNEWNSNYHGLDSAHTKLSAVATFHAKFLAVHPFRDGNGRVARAILMQQCLDLFGKADMTLMNKGTDYYAALKSADAGDYTALIDLIDPIVHS
jgi:Fic family protein